MRLDEAFDAAIKKFYEGYDFSETSKVNPKMAEYSFGSLDKIHKEIVPKRGAIMETEIEEDEGILENDD